MITLKTLPQATAQEVFDQVAKHLLTQGARAWIPMTATANGGCRYRTRATNDGKILRCAAGCLITDNEYRPSWEGCSWSDLVDKLEVTAAHRKLIAELQHIHDIVPENSWRVKLEELADELKLNTDVLNLGELV